MRQLPPDLQERWMALAASTAEQYEGTDHTARRRWTTPGTSIGTARELDVLAEALTRLLLQEPSATPDNDNNPWRGVFSQPSPQEWPLQRTLDFFAQQDVYDILLKQPEAKGAWFFTEKPSKKSARRNVDIAGAITGWISGEPIPRLATTWLPDLDSEWALEQTVSNISETFEHYLAWTVGALVNLVNLRLEETHAMSSACPPPSAGTCAMASTPHKPSRCSTPASPPAASPTRSDAPPSRMGSPPKVCGPG